LRIKRGKFYFSIHTYISNKLGHSLQHMKKERYHASWNLRIKRDTLLLYFSIRTPNPEQTCIQRIKKKSLSWKFRWQVKDVSCETVHSLVVWSCCSRMKSSYTWNEHCFSSFQLNRAINFRRFQLGQFYCYMMWPSWWQMRILIVTF